MRYAFAQSDLGENRWHVGAAAHFDQRNIYVAAQRCKIEENESSLSLYFLPELNVVAIRTSHDRKIHLT
jgi:hypothetical protein